jgi:hypothetical protein
MVASLYELKPTENLCVTAEPVMVGILRIYLEVLLQPELFPKVNQAQTIPTEVLVSRISATWLSV